MSDWISLKLFVRAAETGSLSEAARVSNLAVAAASRRIANLEHRYRVQLFQRSRQGMMLTNAGQAFLENALLLLDQAHVLDAEMADFAGGVRGTIRVHVNPSAIVQFLPADLAGFATQRPDIRLDLAEHWSGDIVENILGERADLGIVIGGTPTGQLETLPYRHDRLVLLAPLGSLGSRESIPFAEVQDQDFVALLQTTALTQTLMAEASKAERKLRLRMQVRSFDGVCRMVEAGFGLGVLPEIAARGFARAMRLDVVPLSDDWAQRTMLICFAPSGAATKITRSLADHLYASAARDQPPPVAA